MECGDLLLLYHRLVKTTKAATSRRTPQSGVRQSLNYDPIRALLAALVCRRGVVVIVLRHEGSLDTRKKRQL